MPNRTLSDCASQGLKLQIVCLASGCTNRVTMGARRLMKRVANPDAPLTAIGRRMHCQRCKSYGAAIEVVPEAEKQTWHD